MQKKLKQPIAKMSSFFRYTGKNGDAIRFINVPRYRPLQERNSGKNKISQGRGYKNFFE
ncbi:hypothetical protein HB839_02530 [Listeria sp. FSL L7-1699]|uniref:Uncharacterized protein n=1 Tax=Listeria farberi TaxID=2713500 RepID=A0ABR6SJI8_9LIST|nr:hypothetical protein [Listeria farberi]MBC1374400.1 hypothetical protein [Listeria farberi]MBC1380948.1 hypothetical protein [Listeria farberi]